jgi:hypothetical protein
MVITKKNVRDIQVKIMAEEQAKAQTNAILKILHVLESKDLNLSDDEIAKMANVPVTQVTLIRNAFASKRTVAADNEFMGSIIEAIKNEVRDTVKDEVKKNFDGVAINVSAPEAKVDEEKIAEAMRPKIESSVADVFSAASGAKLEGAKVSSGGKVTDQLKKLKDLKGK